jgi:hypothetical protein
MELLGINSALEYAIRNAQENQVGLKLNGTHQLLTYADDVNLLGDNIDTIKKNSKVKLSRNRPWRPIGLQDVKDPTLSRQSAHRWR